MVNSDQTRQEVHALGLNPSVDTIPNPIPVVETNPKLLRPISIAKIGSSTGAQVTAYTVPTTGIYHLHGFSLSFSKAVDGTATSAFLKFLIFKNATYSEYRMACNTLQVDRGDSVVMLPRPIRLEPGGLLVNGMSTSTGTQSCFATFFVEQVDAAEAER